MAVYNKHQIKFIEQSCEILHEVEKHLIGIIREGITTAEIDQVAEKIILEPFVFTHKPELDSSLYGIAGHLHPAVTVTGKGGLKETLPCFCFGPRTALLPAFGSFTGNQVIHPTVDDRIYVIAGDEVIEMQKATTSK